MKKYIIWGGTGHAKVIYELLMTQGGASVAAVVDNAAVAPPLKDVPLLQGEDGLRTWFHENPSDYCGVAAIGTSGVDRLHILSLFTKLHIATPTLFHAQAFVAKTAHVSEGSHILARACVCANASVGRGVIVNTGSIVEHDAIIGEGTHLAPGVTLSGEVRIGSCCFIGAGTTILPRITIDNHCIVGAGSVVTRNLEAGTVAYGVPAKAMRKV